MKERFIVSPYYGESLQKYARKRRESLSEQDREKYVREILEIGI